MQFPAIYTGARANAEAAVFGSITPIANENVAPPAPAPAPVTASAFKVGQVYATRSLCDYDCIYRFTVKARTDKTVTLLYHGELVRRKVFVSDGIEWTYPLGSYSMAPIIRASKGDIQ